MLKKNKITDQCKVCFLYKKGENKNEHLDWVISDQEALDRFIGKNSIVSVCGRDGTTPASVPRPHFDSQNQSQVKDKLDTQN